MKNPLKSKKNITNASSASVSKSLPGWHEVLMDASTIPKSLDFRVALTKTCKDADYIPKVKQAGQIKVVDGTEYQIMHNGLLVESGGYFGDWMQQIIESQKGHHEPQEEKAFYEILKLVPAGSTMLELGSYWSYYSLWFNQAIKEAKNYCCEPDPKNLALGKRNALINKAKNMTFIQSAAGEDDGKVISFLPQEGGQDAVDVPIRSVDSIVTENAIKELTLLHMDVQGEELHALQGARKAIQAGKIRFIFVSTHHYEISRDIQMHEKCLALIKDWGGHIIVEHAIHESFSGDGLIVASFDKADKNRTIQVSDNRLQDSVFRSYLEDMQILIDAYEKLRSKES